MFSELHEVEGRILNLIAEDVDWRSYYIDYHPPVVERLVRDVTLHGVVHRVYLHRIHPCGEGEDLFHPHPWPSAMRILDGRYQMELGFGVGEVSPPVFSTVILSDGDEYEMTHRDGWHRVRPLGQPVYSLMVAGPPWARPSPKGDRAFRPLKPVEQGRLLDMAQIYYGLRREVTP